MANSFQEKLKSYEKITGSLASFVSVIMFFSLFEVLFSNLRGESQIFILPLATTFNGLFWSLYAYGRKDWYLLIPNSLALVLGMVTTISAFLP